MSEVGRGRHGAPVRDHAAVHRFLRVLSTALVVGGVIVLADVGLTLAWKEPLSSLYGTIQQQRAADELDELEESFLDELPDVAGLTHVKAARRLAGAFEHELETGEGIGRIRIPRIDLDAVVVQGTDDPALQNGPGHYPSTGIPGQGTTIGVAGHRTTYLAPLRRIDEVEDGDEVIIEMPYGTFTYVVEKHRIVEPTDVEIVREVGKERIVLTACHPLYSAAQRYALFGRLIEIDLAEPAA
jgi:sortase A